MTTQEAVGSEATKASFRGGSRIWLAIAIAVYLGSALYLTWPMPVHIGSQLYGQGGDAFGTVGLQQLADRAGLVPFLPGTIPSIGAPHGRPWDYPLSVTTLVVTTQRWLLSLAFGVVAAWNLWVLFGYVFSSLSMFLLVRRLTGSSAAGLISGWAFAFFPFADIRGGAHVDFMQTWPLVILVWRLIELRSSVTRRNGVLVAAAITLCILFNPYFWLFAGAIVGTMLVLDLASAVRSARLRAHLKAWLWGVAPPILVLAFLEVVNLTYSAGATVPSNGISDAVLYSARPLDYLIPIPGSGLLPSGDFASDYARGIAVGERGLYVGWTVLALAIVGLALTIWGRAMSRQARRDVLGISLIGLVGLAFSAVPVYTIAGHTIHLPSYYIADLSGAWRVFARFVVVVMMALCVLAGVAIARISNARRPWVVAPLLIVISCVIVKDLWWKAVPSTITLPTNPIWQLVGRQHDNKLAAEYPLVIDIYSDYRYMLSVNVIRHRLLNGYLYGTPDEQRAMWLEPLNDPETAAELARLGVRWVMVNKSDNPPVNSIPPGTPGQGFRFVAREAGWSLWRVTAVAARTQVYPTTHFSYPFGTAGALGAWLTADTGKVRIEASGCRTGCSGTLQFGAVSFARGHVATFSLGDHVLARTVISTSSRTIKFAVRLIGPITDISVRVTPPGVSPESVNGSGDTRPLSIAIQEPHFTVAP